MFDQLLLIDAGKMVYFGPVGAQCDGIVTYFEDYGARPHCKSHNPSEWMFEMTSSSSVNDWPDIWRSSPEHALLQKELSDFMKLQTRSFTEAPRSSDTYAMAFLAQVKVLIKRTIIDCWRTPTYLWGKLMFYIRVASTPSRTFYIYLRLSVADHWFFVLECAKIFTRPAKSAFCRIPCGLDV
jgi:hypothetical protein